MSETEIYTGAFGEFDGKDPKGTGAYVPDPASYIPQKALDSKRNPDHFMGWSHNAKPVDLIRVRPVVEQTTRVLALTNGFKFSPVGSGSELRYLSLAN